jgi:3,4-dihydroxy-2-butanone 4-phosphate synthase
VAQVSASAKSDAPDIVLKRPAVTDVDGVPILVVASDYRDGRGELVQPAHVVSLSAVAVLRFLGM